MTDACSVGGSAMRFMTSRAAEPMGKCRKGAGGEDGASRPPAGSRIISAMHTLFANC